MGTGGVDAEATAWLLCRAATCLCALPVDHVNEVMRPLPIEPLSHMPQFLLGLCIIRGLPVPVVDAGLLLNGGDSRTKRLVTIAVEDRTIALAVEQVIGIRSIDPRALNMLQPLLQNTAGDAVEAIRALDRVTARQLRALGYRIHDAETGPAALAIIDAGERFDLLFTDIGLPGQMNGIELADRARQRLPGLRVLFTTGYGNLGGQSGDAVSQLEFLIHKPYRSDELAAKLRAALASDPPA